MSLTSSFILVLGATALVSTLVGLWLWRRRDQAGAEPLSLAAGAVSIIAVGYAIELASPSLNRILLAARLQYVGLVLLPVFWFSFALAYTGRDNVRYAPYRAFLLIIPAITMILVLTNPWHGLIWARFGVTAFGDRIFFDPDYGPWFWVHTAYSYGLIVPATLLLVIAAWRTHRLFRRQALMLAAAVLAPLLGNVLYLLRIGPGQSFDLTPILFGMSVGLVALVTMKGRLLEVMPVARTLTFEQMRDGVVVLDRLGRVVDLNAAAMVRIGKPMKALIGQPIAALLPPDTVTPPHMLTAYELDEEVEIRTGQDRRWYTTRIFPLYGWRGQLKGRIIHWHDVTKRRQDEELLRLRNGELEALHDAAILLSSRQESARVFETVVTRAAALVGAQAGYVAVLNAQAEAMVIEVGIGLFAPIVGMRLRHNEGLVGQVWSTGEPALIDDYATWQRRLIDNEHLAAMVGYPLIDQGEIVGVIALCYTERGVVFDNSTRTLLERFARLASLAVKNARLYASLEQELAERQRTELALAQARDAAEASSRAKSTFIANMSHELRTPLTVIMGYAQLIKVQLKSGDYSTIPSELDTIVSSAKHQLALISDLLDLAKIEAGHMELKRTEFSVFTLLEETSLFVLPLVESGGNELIVDAPDDIGTFWGDQQKLRQILINLLSNAAKFTENGTITLQAQRCHTADTTSLVLQVADTGIGIPAPFLATIFEEFAQVARAVGRTYGGTGLGLAICKRYVELMGGTISVASEEGRGSIFTVELPFAAEYALPHSITDSAPPDLS